jgi:actin-related protein
MDAYIDAQCQEYKKEAEKEHERKRSMVSSHTKAHVKIAQIELKDSAHTLRKELDRITEKRLKPYIIFQGEHIKDQEDLDFIQTDFNQTIEDILAADISHLDMKELTLTTYKAKQYISALQDMYARTVDNAVEKSDDTKMLKELLELMA